MESSPNPKPMSHLITDADNDTGTVNTTDTSPWQEKAVLERLYLERGLTTREIADELGCTNSTVSRWLGIHDIPARDNWVAGVEAAKRANRVEYAKLWSLPSGYEFWSEKWDRKQKVVYVHRLLAVAEYGFDAVAGNDVHHKNGIPWDNRHENVEPIDKSEHGGLHSREYWGGVEE